MRTVVGELQPCDCLSASVKSDRSSFVLDMEPAPVAYRICRRPPPEPEYVTVLRAL